MRKLIIIILGAVLFSSASCQMKKATDSAEQSATNLKPMYGKGKKTKAQLEADQEFLATCDNTYSSRQEAAIAHIELGWQYMESGDNETAMKRFNQAWLLDSLNAEVYWGFGTLMYNDLAPKESMELFEKAIQLDPKNPIFYFWQALNAERLYVETKDDKYKTLEEEYLQKAEKLDPSTNYRRRLKGTE